MLRVNKLLAKVSVAIALVLLLLWLVTPLWHSAVFSLFVIFWCFETVYSRRFQNTKKYQNRLRTLLYTELLLYLKTETQLKS